MLTLFSNRSSRHTIQKPSRLWVFAVKNRAAPRRARILATFKTTQYPCMFAHSQKSKKHRFFSRPRHNLAPFKNIQFPIAAAQRPRPKAQRQKNIKKSLRSPRLCALPRGAAAPYTAYKHNMRPSLPRQRRYLTTKYPTRSPAPRRGSAAIRAPTQA